MMISSKLTASSPLMNRLFPVLLERVRLMYYICQQRKFSEKFIFLEPSLHHVLREEIDVSSSAFQDRMAEFKSCLEDMGLWNSMMENILFGELVLSPLGDHALNRDIERLLSRASTLILEDWKRDFYEKLAAGTIILRSYRKMKERRVFLENLARMKKRKADFLRVVEMTMDGSPMKRRRPSD